MGENAIKIDLERYNELIRKETLLDKLMEGKDISVYLYHVVNEEGEVCRK